MFKINTTHLLYLACKMTSIEATAAVYSFDFSSDGAGCCYYGAVIAYADNVPVNAVGKHAETAWDLALLEKWDGKGADSKKARGGI